MKKKFYPLYYKLNQENKYLIWEIGTDSEDTFYIDTKYNKIPIFSNLKSLRKYAKTKNIKIVKDSKPIIHDLDIVLKWIKSNCRTTINCDDILSAWNFFIDMANTFKLDNDELQAYRSKSPKAYKIYSKIFDGNNLPSITPKNKHYKPKWKRKELKLIKRIFSFGFQEFKYKGKLDIPMKKSQIIFENAQLAWNQGNNKKSFKLYKKCALMGHTICYEYLAYMYFDGKGVKKNYKKAMHWYKKADKAGYPSYINIGSMYSDGEGVKKNIDKAMYWYLKGVEQKDSTAMFNIAILYKDQYKYKKMIKWFKKSFKYNDGNASYELARIYLSKAKIKKSIKYLKIAINHTYISQYDREKSQLYLDRIEKFKKKNKRKNNEITETII